MKKCKNCGAYLDAGEKCDCGDLADIIEIEEEEELKSKRDGEELRLEVVPFEPVKEISFNKAELEDRLKVYLKKYEGLIVTKDMAAEIKKERANLNKLKKALNDEKIRQKKLFSEPIVLFEADVKKLISMIENAILGLDSQLKAFDEEEKQKKFDTLKKFFNENVGELKELITFESIYKDRWSNKSESLTTCQNDIKSKLFQIGKELEAIKEQCVDFYFECERAYLKSFNLVEALSLESELKKKKELYMKAKEEEEQKAEVVSREEAFFNAIVPDEARKEEKRFKVTFELFDTVAALNELKAFMDARGMNYTVLK